MKITSILVLVLFYTANCHANPFKRGEERDRPATAAVKAEPVTVDLGQAPAANDDTGDEQRNATLLYEVRNLLNSNREADLAVRAYQSAGLANLMALARECKAAQSLSVFQAKADSAGNVKRYQLETKPLTAFEESSAAGDFLYQLFSAEQYEFRAQRLRALNPDHLIVCTLANGKTVRLVADNEHGFLQRISTQGKPVGGRFEVEPGFVRKALERAN